jgi:serine phosphatase RsbU (regulator of sigma subunit)/CHASE3 domain sensor protein
MLLRRRLLLLFAAILVGVLVLGGIAAAIIRSRDQTRISERRLGVAREQAVQLSVAYIDQETGARGFVLTGQDQFLEPFHSGTEEAKRLVSSLESLAREEPSFRAPLVAAVRDAGLWEREAARPAIAARTAGDVTGSAAAITGVGKNRFDDLRTDLGRLSSRVDTAAAAAESRASQARSRLTWMLIAIVAVAIAGTLVASWFIRRWITQPLGTLGEQVRKTRALGAGETIAVDGPPEISGLADDVETMRHRIVLQGLEAERSRKAVEQSAAVLLALRAHLEPEVGPLPRGWTLAAQLRAAEGVVAGDCYDLVFLEGERVGLAVIDIAGHGATEGITALRCKELLRASLSSGLEPGAALEAAADQLGDLGEEVFLTAFVAVIDTVEGRVRFANAGHPPASVAGTDSLVELLPTGPLVGLIGSGWRTDDAKIAPGDTLCVYTDGLIEVRDSSSEFFGPERLADLVQGSRGDEAPSVVKRCLDDVEAFAAGGLRDDATIVVVCRPGG